MDRLGSLPSRNTMHSQEEQNVMDKYFSDSSEADVEPESQEQINWKTLLYSTVLFFVLSIGAIDNSLCFASEYCENSAMLRLLIKSVLFLVISVLIKYFA